MGKLVRLERRQTLAVGIDDAWRFFSDPANLPLITPPELGFTLASALPDQMHPGMIASYTVTPFGWYRVGWITEITHVVKPHLFVDEQRFGPYRFWHHQHHFRELDGGVEITDIIHYMLPFQPLSLLAAPLVVRQLDAIFEFRRHKLDSLFSGPKVPSG